MRENNDQKNPEYGYFSRSATGYYFWLLTLEDIHPLTCLGVRIFFDFLVGMYLFKINNGNTKTISEIYSKLTINAPEWLRFGDFIVDFEQILHIPLVFSLLTLNNSICS